VLAPPVPDPLLPPVRAPLLPPVLPPVPVSSSPPVPVGPARSGTAFAQLASATTISVHCKRFITSLIFGQRGLVVG
jgi:hypothetical protein